MNKKFFKATTFFGLTTIAAIPLVAVACGDSQDDKDVEAAKKLYEYLKKSSKTEVAFKAVATFVTEKDLNVTSAAELGIELPTGLPSGIMVKVTKPVGSAVLSYKVTKNGASVSFSVTFDSFKSQDQDDVDAAKEIYSKKVNTSKTRTEFETIGTYTTEADFTTLVATALGIELPTGLPTGLTTKISKPSNSVVVTYKVQKGSASATFSVTFTTFA